MLVRGQLPAVIGLDAVARELECLKRRAIADAGRSLDLAGIDAQSDLLEIDPIEISAELDQRRIAALGDVGDDRAHGRLDVLGRLAFCQEECLEALGEIRRTGIKADRHRASRRNARQWRAIDGSVNPEPITR